MRLEIADQLWEILFVPVAATQLLWDTYHPQLHVWIPFAIVGVITAVALWIFGRLARRWSDMNA